MAEPDVVSLGELDTVALTQSETDMEVHANFPFTPDAPATTGLELEGGHTVVYFEIPPGKALATHTESPEELVLCLEGEEIEAHAGDATGRLETGDLIVVPPTAPHGFRNGGDETARFVGFFSDSTNVVEFEHDLEPLGERMFKI
jgi:quercetin dioxygenase-like cupin family protein